MFLLLIFAFFGSSADWRYEARVCGNVMVNEAEVPRAVMLVRRDGCVEAKVERLFDDTYLVYGTKVVRSTEY
jgi:hypothetical protein